MSAEVISIILAAAALFVTLGGSYFAGSAWLIKRMDDRFNAVHLELRGLRNEMRDIRNEVQDVREDVNDVKMAVARLEGPQPRLILPR